MEVNVRKETPQDIEAITLVTMAAFETLEISNQTEHFIIKALRAQEGLTLSLVAEVDGSVIGHIAFSPANISDGTTNWYGLGPIAVFPTYQKQGVGKRLINKGLLLLKEMGGQGCVLVGDPGYYQQFGFKNYLEMTLEGIPQEFFMALPFTEEKPQGKVKFHEGFLANG